MYHGCETGPWLNPVSNAPAAQRTLSAPPAERRSVEWTNGVGPDSPHAPEPCPARAARLHGDTWDPVAEPQAASPGRLVTGRGEKADSPYGEAGRALDLGPATPKQPPSAAGRGSLGDSPESACAPAPAERRGADVMVVPAGPSAADTAHAWLCGKDGTQAAPVQLTGSDAGGEGVPAGEAAAGVARAWLQGAGSSKAAPVQPRGGVAADTGVSPEAAAADSARMWLRGKGICTTVPACQGGSNAEVVAASQAARAWLLGVGAAAGESAGVVDGNNAGCAGSPEPGASPVGMSGGESARVTEGLITSSADPHERPDSPVDTTAGDLAVIPQGSGARAAHGHGSEAVHVRAASGSNVTDSARARGGQRWRGLAVSVAVATAGLVLAARPKPVEVAWLPKARGRRSGDAAVDRAGKGVGARAADTRADGLGRHAGLWWFMVPLY